MKTIISTNPAKNYEVIGEVPASTKEEIEQAVQRAKKAFKTWKQTDIKDRIEILKKLNQTLQTHGTELAKLITEETGKPISSAKGDVTRSLSKRYLWYLENAEEILKPEVIDENEKERHVVYREPYGVAAVIYPWNFPLDIFVWGSIPNLLAGNTVIAKGPEECILLGKKLEELIKQADVPDGVFQIIHGDGEEGAILVDQEINLIHFTGSSGVGRELYKKSADKFIHCVLELGGSAPGIVCEDADISSVVESIFWDRFFNTGQCCDALKRLIVHESKLEEVKQKLTEIIEKVKVDQPEKEETVLGPLVSKAQVELLESQIQDAIAKGAQILTGGKRPETLLGAYYLPTLLSNITQEMRVWHEEVFGPVLPIITFNTEEEAIELANNTEYGLGGYVFTSDKDRALRIGRAIETGNMKVNNSSYWNSMCNPFGGFKLSGIGREHGKYGFHDITQLKVITLEK